MAKVIVVGGGPSGIMAAISAAKQNHSVTLIERNDLNLLVVEDVI